MLITHQSVFLNTTMTWIWTSTCGKCSLCTKFKLQQQQQQQVEVLASCRHEWASSSICVSSPHRNRSLFTKAKSNPNNSIYLSIWDMMWYDVCMYVCMYVYWPRSGSEMLLTLAGPPPAAARPRRRTRTTLSIWEEMMMMYVGLVAREDLPYCA